MADTSHAPLTNIPDEILLEILSIACHLEDSIEPVQVVLRSQTFYNKNARKNEICESKTNIAMISYIARTLKQFARIMVGERLLFRCNKFQFANTKSLLRFLGTIPIQARNAIGSLSIRWDCDGNPQTAFALLSKCKELRHLNINISGLGRFFAVHENEEGEFIMRGSNYTQIPGFEELSFLRGVQELSIEYLKDRPWSLPLAIATRYRGQNSDFVHVQAAKNDLKQFEAQLKLIVTAPTVTGSSLAEVELQRAIDHAITIEGGYIDHVQPAAAQSTRHTMQILTSNVAQPTIFANTSE